MQNLLKNWNIVRGLYLIASITILYAAYDFGNNIFLYILGFGFLAQTLLNVGCSSGQCRRPTNFNYRRRH